MREARSERPAKARACALLPHYAATKQRLLSLGDERIAGSVVLDLELQELMSRRNGLETRSGDPDQSAALYFFEGIGQRCAGRLHLRDTGNFLIVDECRDGKISRRERLRDVPQVRADLTF